MMVLKWGWFLTGKIVDEVAACARDLSFCLLEREQLTAQANVASSTSVDGELERAKRMVAHLDARLRTLMSNYLEMPDSLQDGISSLINGQSMTQN